MHFVFILTDTAETKTALAIQTQLSDIAQQETRYITFTFVLLGEGAKTTVERFPPISQFNCIEADANYSAPNRELQLTAHEMSLFYYKISKFGIPNVVYSGVVSIAQQQFMLKLKNAGATVLSYCDALEWHRNFTSKHINEILTSTDKYWLANEGMYLGYKKISYKIPRSEFKKIHITGHPDTENFKQEYLTKSTTQLKKIKTTLQQHGILPPGQPIEKTICYVGAYNFDKKSSYALNVGAFGRMMALIADEGYHAILSLHPGQPLATEEQDAIASRTRDILEETKTETDSPYYANNEAKTVVSSVTIIPKSFAQEHNINTTSTCAVSGVIATYASTVATQIVYTYPHLLVLFARDPSDTLPIPQVVELGLAKLVRTPEELRSALHSHLQSHRPPPDAIESKVVEERFTPQINPLLVNSACNMAHVAYAQGTVNYQRQNKKRAAKLGVDLPPHKKSRNIQRRLAFFTERSPASATANASAHIKRQ